MLVGAHMSIAGGVHRAVERAACYGMTALQIFTRSARAWRGPPLSDEEVGRFGERLRRSSVQVVVAHASYLVNPASPERALRRRSERALVCELSRCERLGVPWLVVHAGSHRGTRREAGVRRAGGVLSRVLSATRGYRAGLLVENTAGQGDTIGGRFGEVREILARGGDGTRLGACLDTCHAFAAGYDLSTADGFARTREELDQEVGLPRVRAVHVNDCRGGCGSRRDRHEGIGQGRIGLAGLRRVVSDRAFHRLPLILETPKGEGAGEDLDLRNLRILRGFSRGSRTGSP